MEFCDGSVVDMQKIKDHFQAAKCPYLVNKPKVLMFPFCRGDEYDLGHPKNQGNLMEPVYTAQEEKWPDTQTEVYPARAPMCQVLPTLWSAMLIRRAMLPTAISTRAAGISKSFAK